MIRKYKKKFNLKPKPKPIQNLEAKPKPIQNLEAKPKPIKNLEAKPIYNLSSINNNTIKKEGLNVLIVSYGGSCSNQFAYNCQKSPLRCITMLWKKILCHCPIYIDVDIPIIYIYDNPIKSFLSQKRRGAEYTDINQKKLSNNENINLSHENLLKLMIKQFNNWTTVKKDNILIIKSSEIFENKIVNKLEQFLKKPIYDFPLKYKEPKITSKDVQKFKTTKLYKKYQVELEKIINF